MKMLFFKFHQNRPIHEEFDFRGAKLKGPVGGRRTRYQKFKKASYRTVVTSHTKNVKILEQLENVKKLGELKRLLEWF